MKKIVLVLLVILVLSVCIMPVFAGVLHIRNVVLNAFSTHYVSSWQTKQSDSNGTHVWFEQSGTLLAVNTRTQADMPNIGLVNANPVVRAIKGDLVWLGGYVELRLIAGIKMRIRLWTGTHGISDVVTGIWTYY